MHYEYVRVEVDKNSPRSSAYMEKGHREIIDRQAVDGKRYVGWFPVTQGPTGKTVEFDLIFEVA